MGVQRRWRSRTPQDGVTLIELIIVMVLLGIISVSVMQRNPGDLFQLDAQVVQLVQDIRLAQSLAMNGGGNHTIRMVSTTSYEIVNGSGVQVSAVTLAKATISNFSVTFNGKGYPGANTVIIALAGNGLTRTVQVIRTTGAVVAS
ncbi:MAG: type II secretion system protein [Magnetococcales bacterium]|nr:type II secretion system protein [Magnetococcales bacterium]